MKLLEYLLSSTAAATTEGGVTNGSANIVTSVTSLTAPTQRQIEEVCWHCSGSGTCPCISCGESLPAGERGRCLLCGGSGRAMAWIQ